MMWVENGGRWQKKSPEAVKLGCTPLARGDVIGCNILLQIQRHNNERHSKHT